ncbi:unnamed protein product [Coregonus sp. 'balchen']|nr:unnamed protein product [Coregonus sp. 'balchen']
MPDENGPPENCSHPLPKIYSPGTRYFKRQKKRVTFSGKTVGCLFSWTCPKELAMKREEVLQRREEKQLHKKNVQAHTGIPSDLLFTWKGKKKIFKDNMEAERFLLEQDV